jgi:hypothetical protein
MPAWRKLEMIWALNKRAKNLAVVGIRERYPGISQREESLRLASNWLTPEELQKWYGWDPSPDG